MLEAEELAQRAADCFQRQALTGVHVLITAGPTQENIDPVRYITNHSSGKMGFALAEAAVEAGARVTLVTGPVHLPTPDRVQRVDVVSARDMLAACEAAMPCDLLIASAAVADYRPEVVAAHKLKKDPTSGEGLPAAGAQSRHSRHPRTARGSSLQRGLRRRNRKPAGLCCTQAEGQEPRPDRRQRRGQPSIGFNSDENAITVIDRDLHPSTFAQTSKGKIARQLIAFIADRLNQQ